MTDRPEGGSRTILVAVDSSPGSLAALRTAADLASRLESELVGLYVEDVDLVRLSGYTFIREVSFYSGTFYEVSQSRTELMLHSQANTVRRALADLRRHESIRTRFLTARGKIATEILQAAEDANLLVLGKTGWSRGRKLGSTAQMVVALARQNTLILPEEARFMPPLAVIFNGEPASTDALEFAEELLDEDQPGEHPDLAVIIPAADITEARALHARLEEWLKAHHRSARYFWLVGPERYRLAEFFSLRRFGGLVMAAPLEGPQVELTTTLINQVNIPVLLVKQTLHRP
jgi:nucleotide-binding universal stress UspA family protein